MSKLSIQTKTRLVNSRINSVLYYLAVKGGKQQIWTRNKINTFQYRSLIKILIVRLPDQIPNKERYMETKTTRVTDIILTRKWKLIGHDIGMQSARIYTTPLT